MVSITTILEWLSSIRNNQLLLFLTKVGQLSQCGIYSVFIGRFSKAKPCFVTEIRESFIAIILHIWSLTVSLPWTFIWLPSWLIQHLQWFKLTTFNNQGLGIGITNGNQYFLYNDLFHLKMLCLTVTSLMLGEPRMSNKHRSKN